jgi:hypothetical protein
MAKTDMNESWKLASYNSLGSATSITNADSDRAWNISGSRRTYQLLKKNTPIIVALTTGGDAPVIKQ